MHIRTAKIFALLSFALTGLLFFCMTAAHASEKKRILIYGDSNTYGYVANKNGTIGRLPVEKTWTGKLAVLLGSQYDIITEGLCGRTINSNYPGYSSAGLNGERYLPTALSSHMPLDLVVIMLGTNDLLNDSLKTARDIADGMGGLIKIVKETRWQEHTNFRTPQVLVVSPPKINITNDDEHETFFKSLLEKSSQLAEHMQKTAEDNKAEFFDAASVVPFAESEDKIHLTVKNHADLAAAVAKKIKAIFRDTAPLQE